MSKSNRKLGPNPSLTDKLTQAQVQAQQANGSKLTKAHENSI